MLTLYKTKKSRSFLCFRYSSTCNRKKKKKKIRLKWMI